MSNNSPHAERQVPNRCGQDPALQCAHWVLVETQMLTDPGSVLRPVPILHIALAIRPTAISQHYLWRTPTTVSAAHISCSGSAQLLSGHLQPDDPQAWQIQLVLWESHHAAPHKPPCLPSSKQPRSPSFLHICYPSKELPHMASLARNLRVNPTTQIQAPSPFNPPATGNNDYFTFPTGQGFLNKIYLNPRFKDECNHSLEDRDSELLQRDLQVDLSSSYLFAIHLSSFTYVVRNSEIVWQRTEF